MFGFQLFSQDYVRFCLETFIDRFPKQALKFHL